VGPSSPENWRDCACRMCDLNCGRRVAPGDVVMERRREMFRSGECPAVSLPLHLPSASFAGQQLGQGMQQSIGCTGEYNASMQAELGASMAERY
jgi:heterodisulfide reductase subunit C